MDHDQRFKTLVQEFFRELVLLFWPHYETILDFDQVEWLKEEYFLNPTQGARLRIDLAARVKTLERLPDHDCDEWLAIVHVEVETRESMSAFRPRAYEYYRELRKTHESPVLPIAIFVNVGMEGVGLDKYTEQFEEGFTTLSYTYRYVGLPALDAREYLDGESLLGAALSALMRVSEDQRAQLTVDALDRVALSEENEYRKYLLLDCIAAYAPLTDEQRAEITQQLNTNSDPEAKMMANTLAEQWFQEGQVEGQRKLLLKQLEAKFGLLSETTQKLITEASPERVEEIALEYANAKTLQELGLEDGTESTE